MSTAALFVEALETLHRLGWALVAWIVLTGAAVTLALYTVTVTVWTVGRWVWKTARRRPGGPSWARGGFRARIHARRRVRRPSGRTADHDYEEAA